MRALIGLARLFKAAQPRLWDYAAKLRDKRFAASMLDTIAMTPVLHVSQRYPAARLCAAPVLPIARHPRIDSRVVVFDLDGDPDWLLDETDETYNLTVGGITGVGTITDDDAPPSLAINDVTVNEAAGTATFGSGLPTVVFGAVTLIEV